MLFRRQPFILWEGDSGGSGGGGQQTPPAQQPPSQQSQTPPATDPNQPGPVPYERFKQVNDQFAAMKAEFEQLKAAQKTAAEKEAEKQGEWEKLAKEREAELKAERLRATRLEVVAEKRLPAELAGRLQGESKEDMLKDADALLKFMAPAQGSNEGPGVPPGSSSGGRAGTPDFSKMTPEEVRKHVAGKSVGEFA